MQILRHTAVQFPVLLSRDNMIVKNEDANEWLTAFHEAGHVLTAYYSTYFELKDEAVRLASPGPGALADIGIIGPSRDFWTADHARDFAVIGFGGYVAEMLLCGPGGMKPNWTVKFNGSQQDQQMIEQELVRFGIADEGELLAGKSLRLIHPNVDKLKELAEVIFNAMKATAPYVPKVDLLPILER
jgi:hypothetical protein